MTPIAQPGAAIVVGYGRVGKVVCSLLRKEAVSHIATDLDPQAVATGRREGIEVYFGDASDPEFLKSCGLQETAGVIITINTREAIDDIVTHIRSMRPDVPIISRAHGAKHARHLYGIGASEAVPETIEASLQLSEAALLGLGVAADSAVASVFTNASNSEMNCLQRRTPEASFEDKILLPGGAFPILLRAQRPNQTLVPKAQRTVQAAPHVLRPFFWTRNEDLQTLTPANSSNPATVQRATS